MNEVIVRCEEPEFIPIDEWEPDEEDIIFRYTKGAIVLPVSNFYGKKDTFLDYFYMTAKRCYNSNDIKIHITKYLNYFEKYYDPDKELLITYYKIKFLIDCQPDKYTEKAFMYDIKQCILDSQLFIKSQYMNSDNYMLDLDKKRIAKKAIKVPSLQYTDKHGEILMHISLMQIMIIPLLDHYMTVRKVMHIKDFLLKAFDMIFMKYDDVADIYNKLYETAASSVNKNATVHKVLWNMQSIRGKNPTTHSISIVDDIILHIMPKYTYDKNIVSFNYKSIQYNIGYQITDISYEYNFISYSSSNRDQENNSEFDKFESHLVKQDESLYLQNKVNCQETMNTIDYLFGPFDQDEIQYVIKRLSTDNNFTINPFQKDLVFNLLYKYFGDTISIKAINQVDYVKLILAAKQILLASGLIVMPYIISGKVTRLMTRKNVNKKELIKLQASPNYKYIKEKYRNEKIENQILSMIASILSSDFEIIDYKNDELDGQVLTSLGDLIIEEVLIYVLMI